ncbi:MAG: tetratricopeptide repeat protein [Ruminococcus sp.]|nr:tetratricopeptide repeat protein [Ruminococcus sp.]
MKLTREDFEKVIEKNNIRNEKSKRLGDLFGKLLIYVFIVEAVIICFIPIGLLLKIFVWIIAVAFTAMVVPLIMSTIIFLGSLKGLSPGILTKLRFGTKYRKSIEKFRNDLCSDRVLAFAENLIEREKNRFSRIALIDQKRQIHNLRCEHNEAFKCVELMRCENEKCGGKFHETIILSELASLSVIDDTESVARLLNSNESIIEDMMERETVPPTVVGTLLTDYEIHNRNYGKALEYCELCAEYREKIRIQTYGKDKPMDNTDIYFVSANLSCMARLFALMGDYEKAEQYLKDATETAENLTCEIPRLLAEEFAKTEMEIFRKNRKLLNDSSI